MDLLHSSPLPLRKCCPASSKFYRNSEVQCCLPTSCFSREEFCLLVRTMSTSCLVFSFLFWQGRSKTGGPVCSLIINFSATVLFKFLNQFKTDWMCLAYFPCLARFGFWHKKSSSDLQLVILIGNLLVRVILSHLFPWCLCIHNRKEQLDFL